MPAFTPSSVPIAVMLDQVVALRACFDIANGEERERMASAGLDEAALCALERLAADVRELDVAHEGRKVAAEHCRLTAAGALAAVLRWRGEEVLPRAQVAFRDAPALVHFRAGMLRSQRPSVVAREARFLIAALRRLAHRPEAAAIGLDEDLAATGQRLLEALLTFDDEEELARAQHEETAALLRRQTAALASALEDYERRVAIAFPPGHEARKRFGLRDIHTYLARARGRKKAAAKRAAAKRGAPSDS